MSVGAFKVAAVRRSCQSNSATRRWRFVVVVSSASFNSATEYPLLAATSSQVISLVIGPDVPLLPSWTRIGYVRQTMITLRTRVGEIPASERQTATVVSLDVTCGYFP